MTAPGEGGPRWAGQPQRCTCIGRIVATLEETLTCPAGWQWRPGVGWIHAGPIGSA